MHPHPTRSAFRALAAVALTAGALLFFGSHGASAGDRAEARAHTVLADPGPSQTFAKPVDDGPPTVIGCSCSLGTGTCGKPNGKQCSAKGTCTGFCMKVWWAAPPAAGRAIH